MAVTQVGYLGQHKRFYHGGLHLFDPVPAVQEQIVNLGPNALRRWRKLQSWQMPMSSSVPFPWDIAPW